MSNGPIRPSILAVVVLSMLGAACGGGKKAASGTTTTTQPPPSTSTAPAVAANAGPLTGLAVDPPGPARPALVVKIDNAPKARPQAGINDADVVVEEGVEGGVTRFATLFQSHDAPAVGPVRSARSTDLLFARQLGRPLFAYSGANAVFEDLVQKAPLVNVGVAVPDRLPPPAGPSGALQPVLGDEGPVRLGRRRRDPAAPLFSYRAVGEAPPEAGSEPAPRVQAVWKLNITTTVVYAWDEASKSFRRTTDGAPHLDAAGVQVAPRERRLPGRGLPQHRARRPVRGRGPRGRPGRRGRRLGPDRRPAGQGSLEPPGRRPDDHLHAGLGRTDPPDAGPHLARARPRREPQGSVAGRGSRPQASRRRRRSGSPMASSSRSDVSACSISSPPRQPFTQLGGLPALQLGDHRCAEQGHVVPRSGVHLVSPSAFSHCHPVPSRWALPFATRRGSLPNPGTGRYAVALVTEGGRMARPLRRWVFPALTLVLLPAVGFVAPGRAGAVPDSTGITTRVSVKSGGGQADATGPAAAGQPAVSDNGAVVAFVSDATNLVPDDHNGVADVFVTQGGTIKRVSVGSLGPNYAEADGPSSSPALSTDGRFVAFVSAADNLVPGDTNDAADVFVYDRQQSTSAG